MAKFAKPCRDLLEYVLYLGLHKVLSVLPKRLAFYWGQSVGTAAYLLDRPHRRVACQNIARVMKWEENEKRTRLLSRRCFQHLAQVVVEFILLPDDLRDKSTGNDILNLDGLDKLEKVLSEKRGVVIISGHTGNWELLGGHISSRIVPLSSVARDFRNPYLAKELVRRRELFKQTLIPKKGAVLKTARVLKRGGAVAFLIDQYAGRKELKIDLLGTPAHTYTAPAMLSKRFQVPVIACFCYRIGNDFKYKGYFEDPIYPNMNSETEEEILRITGYANRAIGDFVMAHPEQWLWMHRKWR